MTSRRPIKTSAADCAIRGGEYTAYDRADYKTALSVWLPSAEAGDAGAQVNVGEIFEKGLGTEPNYEMAALWYRKAAEQGNRRGQFNIGSLYEQGLGVSKDPAQA
ncbi:MAG: sel1 repeat family protein, partial [Cellvibrionaceae bacterium]|nr:sel1 repeat family protein [Cellvibrionaceae bacterium]